MATAQTGGGPELARALALGWADPAFRAGLHRLIEIPEIRALLAALGEGPPGTGLARPAVDLGRAALESAEVRAALLTLIEERPIRYAVLDWLTLLLGRQPALTAAIRSAAEDPAVRHEIRTVLADPGIRAAFWHAVDGRLADRTWQVIRYAGSLLLGHRSAQRLGWLLRRHGVVRVLRTSGRSWP